LSIKIIINNLSMETTTNTEGGEVKSKSNFRMFLFGLIGLVGLVILGAIAFGTYRAYAQVATDPFTATVASILRLPALKVGDQKVLYSDYLSDLKAIHVMQQYDKANNGPGAELTAEQMSDQVLLRLSNMILVNKAAKNYNLSVTDKDISDLKAQMLQQFKDEADANAQLMKRYGWTMAQYQEKVMKPFILQNKLSDAIAADPTLQTDIRNQAQQVLSQILNGADFATMAKQYGSDATAEQGGDLGWFGKGDMVPQFETAAFSLKKGEVDPVLVETQFGYHIIKLVDKRTTTAKDATTGKSVTKDEIRASHILFPYLDLGTYLDRISKQTDYHLYINVHNPFLPSTSTQQ